MLTELSDQRCNITLQDFMLYVSKLNDSYVQAHSRLAKYDVSKVYWSHTDILVIRQPKIVTDNQFFYLSVITCHNTIIKLVFFYAMLPCDALYILG